MPSDFFVTASSAKGRSSRRLSLGMRSTLDSSLPDKIIGGQTDQQPRWLQDQRQADFSRLEEVFELEDGPLPNIPLKEPRLKQGERALLFLCKREPSNTQLMENQFTMVGLYPYRGNLVYGKLLVQNGEARNTIFGHTQADAPWEPLNEIIAVITGWELASKVLGDR